MAVDVAPTPHPVSGRPVPSPGLSPAELRIVFVLAAVQFVNILDFVMVMPLGPDFAESLGIGRAELGDVAGAYTAAAAVSGLVGSVLLDRFPRRTVLAVSMVGLFVGTAAGGFATGLGSMLAARVLAGVFGGPASSTALAMVADYIPPERRGRAMGLVMGAFSVSSVVGVPAGLELARLGGWPLSFFVVAGLGGVVAAFGAFALPPLPGAAAGGGGLASIREVVADPLTRLSVVATALQSGGAFAVIPNLPTFLQENLGYPRDLFGLLYLFGGILSFGVLQVGGRLVDGVGSGPVSVVAHAWLGAVLIFGIGWHQPWLPVTAIFVAFMAGMSLRNVAWSALSSKIPRPATRAGYMSLQSAAQHAAAAAGAAAASRLLSEGPGATLLGMERVVSGTLLAFVLCVPLLLHLEARVRARAPT